jgi:digeranylgeranylglycerophospholipid reductase
MRCDVAVVGNGPSGCVAARFATKGHDTVIIGAGQRRVQCAGLISDSGLKRIGMEDGRYIINRIRGARIYSPGGIEIEVDAGGNVASAVDRLRFDEELLNKAVDSGAKYLNGHITSIKDALMLQDGQTITADKTILATGTDYTLQIKEGIDRPKDYVVGGQYEMKVECDPDFVELYFNIPDFFAWVIPLGDRARVGLCVRGNPRPHLDSFVKKLGARVKSDKVFAESFGIIPIHKPNIRTQYPRLVTVGDAAGQVKASTGGGIIFGCIAAEHAMDADYERSWRREIGYDLRLHLMIHKTLDRMSDKGKDRLFKIVEERHRTLEMNGDMDYAEKTVSCMLKDPGFIAKTLLNLPWLIGSVI